MTKKEQDRILQLVEENENLKLEVKSLKILVKILKGKIR